jgi:uncharacterized protein (TIGR03437 family)
MTHPERAGRAVALSLWTLCGVVIAAGQVPGGHAAGAKPAVFSITPLVNSIAPSSVTQGNLGFAITVTGGNFALGDQVAVNDIAVPTEYISSTQLVGSVPAENLQLPGQLPISVEIPGPPAISSNQVFLTIVPAPTLVSATPQDVIAGSPGFTLTVVGSQFLPRDTVVVGGIELSTTYLSANQLTAYVPAALLVNSGRFNVVVAAPDGPVSNDAALIVAPVLKSLGNVQVNGNQVTIDATGGGFVPADFVALTANGIETNLPTTFLSPTLLRATMTPAALQIGAGLFNVAAPDGSGSPFLSFALPFAISSFTPGGTFAGGPAFNLIVSGGIFPPGSLVLWNGAPLTTTVTSLTQLSANVPASLIASPGVVTIQIVHPNGTTASSPFAINSGSTIFDLNPSSAAAGGQTFTLTLNGGGFLRGAVVQWNGTPLATVFVSATQLTATVSASLIATAGAASIEVINAGGAPSNQLSFAITPSAAPAGITGLMPSTVVAGGPDLVLTVQGTGFVAASTVDFNGSPLVTTFVGSGQLVATVPAALTAVAGTAKITVSADSVVSNASTFTILAGPPVTSTAAIVNLGNEASPIAPGSLVSIYGSQLSLSAAAASRLPLPNSLSSVSVLINGIPAPLLYVGPSQINAQVPFEAPPGAATLIVNLGGVPSAPVIFQLQPIGPGVWTLPGGSATLAVNDSNGNLVTPSNPVAPGTYVTFYLTGQGALNNPVPTGGAAPPTPLATPVASVDATVGGVAADAVSALAPGLVGILQVNIQIPAVASGNQPLAVTVGGVPSNVTFLPIASQ